MIARPGMDHAGMLSDGGLMEFPNVLLPTGPMPYADVGKTLEESVVCWDDLKWIRDLWDGKIVVKGVHTAEDARRVVDEGADALVVSNHGGRQLDGVPGSIRSLPEVVAAAGNQDRSARGRRHPQRRRRGEGALAWRASAVLVGRAYAYGLAAAGEPGVASRDRDSSHRHRAHDEAAGRVIGARSRTGRISMCPQAGSRVAMGRKLETRN